MAKGRRLGGARRTARKGAFDPDDVARVQHTRVGVWDLYEERHPKLIWRLPGFTTVEHYADMLQNIPYVWRMLKDISRIPNCWLLLCCFLLVEFAASLIPAASLWYSGQLLTIVQEAIDTRMVDEQHLLRISAARVCCSIAKRFLSYFRSRLSYTLNARLKQHFSVHLFHARARLDLPTFEDPAVQRQLEHMVSMVVTLYGTPMTGEDQAEVVTLNNQSETTEPQPVVEEEDLIMLDDWLQLAA